MRRKMKDMKLSFSTIACITADIDAVLSYAVNAGIKGIEMRLDKEENICGMGIDRADVIKAKFEAAGCVITDLATSVSVRVSDDKALTAAMRCIDLAEAVNAPAIRIFVGGGVKTFNDIPEHDLAGAAQTVGEICSYAKAHGVEIWAETHSSLSSAKALCGFIDTVGADNLKVLWDVLHSIEFREPIDESLRIIGDRLAHIHLKDAVEPADPNLTQYRYTALGAGTFPLRKLLSLLDAREYNGYLSLEFELPWRRELQDCYSDTDEILAAYKQWISSAR